MVAVKTDVFCSIRPLFSCAEEQFPHLSEHHARKVLTGPWTFRIKFPQTKGAMFAGQCSANHHDLRHLDQVEVSF